MDKPTTLNKIIRIGTRESKLALWQAVEVQKALEALGHTCELVPIKSPGDIDLTTPLHQFGTIGIFTKILDDALYADKIDIAVHSLKDYPTQPPDGLVIAAVLERGPARDILVHKGDLFFLEDGAAGTVATGSIRRVAQWKSHFPKHKTTGLRGNVQTRLKKLEESNWHGAIFAKAGLYRIGLLPEKYVELDWMIPAPAQGTIGIGCRQKDSGIVDLLQNINHPESFLCAKIERDFLRTVEGGCSAPVGAFAEVKNAAMHLTAGVFELDGSHKVVLESSAPLAEAENLGTTTAKEALAQGARQIMEKIKHA